MVPTTRSGLAGGGRGAQFSPAARGGAVQRPTMRRRPEDSRTRVVPEPRAVLALSEDLGRARPGLEGGSGPPQSRGGLGADYSGTSKIRTLGIDPLRGSDERSGGPCAAAGGTRPCSQAEEDGPGCLSGVGSGGTHLSFVFLSVKWDYGSSMYHIETLTSCSE